jgi:signal peptidase I
MADGMRVRTAAARAGLAGLALTSLLAGCGLVPNSLRTYEQTGPSMAPSIQIGDVINRSGVGTPYRGEVVFVNSHVDQFSTGNGLWIKRIVGLPGEQISADNGVVTINGRRLSETYLAPGTVTSSLTPTTIPAGGYYLLGDNRGSSEDSRSFGVVARKDLEGSSHRIVRPSKHAGRIKGT